MEAWEGQHYGVFVKVHVVIMCRTAVIDVSGGSIACFYRWAALSIDLGPRSLRTAGLEVVRVTAKLHLARARSCKLRVEPDSSFSYPRVSDVLLRTHLRVFLHSCLLRARRRVSLRALLQ